MAGTHQNIQYLGAGGMYGGNTTVGGGGVPVARTELDFLRMGVGREPSAEYPDGYLGTIRSRRDDKGKPYGTSEEVLDSLKTRVNQRSYQRGVHRGERIDPSDYYYPEALKPDRGIKRQMKGKRVGNVILNKRNADVSKMVPAPHLPNDGKAGPNVRSDSPMILNGKRVSQFDRMRPAWK